MACCHLSIIVQSINSGSLDAGLSQAGDILHTNTSIIMITDDSRRFRGLKARNFRVWMHNFRVRGSLLAVYECFVHPTICYYRFHCSIRPFSLGNVIFASRMIGFQLVLTRLVCDYVCGDTKQNLPSTTTTMGPPKTLMVPGKIIISSNLLQGDDSRDGSF